MLLLDSEEVTEEEAAAAVADVDVVAKRGKS